MNRKYRNGTEKEWKDFFTSRNIAALVLLYRLPHGHHQVPADDLLQAMRLTRQHAALWHIDPGQIGIMGSSAGGHLATTVATHAPASLTPAFQILFYPVITMDPAYTHQGSHDNLLGKNPKKKTERLFSNELQVTRATPRAFITLSDGDDVVQPANGVNYYLECCRHDVPATLHVYPTDGHGWGYRESFSYHLEMVLELKAWLATF